MLLVLVAISCFTDVWLPIAQGEEAEPAGIVIMSTMIILSGLLRFWQEFRTNKAAQALKSMVKTTATGPGARGTALHRSPAQKSTSVNWFRAMWSISPPEILCRPMCTSSSRATCSSVSPS